MITYISVLVSNADQPKAPPKGGWRTYVYHIIKEVASSGERISIIQKLCAWMEEEPTGEVCSGAQLLQIECFNGSSSRRACSFSIWADSCLTKFDLQGPQAHYT